MDNFCPGVYILHLTKMGAKPGKESEYFIVAAGEKQIISNRGGGGGGDIIFNVKYRPLLLLVD